MVDRKQKFRMTIVNSFLSIERLNKESLVLGHDSFAVMSPKIPAFLLLSAILVTFFLSFGIYSILTQKYNYVSVS